MAKAAKARGRLETLLLEGAIMAWSHVGENLFRVTTLDGFVHDYTQAQVLAYWAGYVTGKKISYDEIERDKQWAERQYPFEM